MTSRILKDGVSFSVGQHFSHEEIIFHIVDAIDDHFLLENRETLERKMISADRLQQLYLAREISPINDPTSSVAFVLRSSASEQIQSSSMEHSSEAISWGRMLYVLITGLRSLGYRSLHTTNLLELDYQKLVRQLKTDQILPDVDIPALSTLYRWSRTLDQNHGDWRALIPRYDLRGGSGKSRISSLARDELLVLLAELKADSNQIIRYADIERRLTARLLRHGNISTATSILPSRATIERITKKELGSYSICRRNRGKQIANQLYRNWYPRDATTAPLQIIEFDDKDSRVFLIDENTGLPYGRAYITSGVDQFSTVPLALSISDQPRNTVSAMDAFQRSVLPKSKDERQFDLLDQAPEFYGFPSVAIFDNALYNHSKAIELAVHESTGAITAWAKPRTPTEKSVVEDFNNRMIRGMFEMMPGYSGAKGMQSGSAEGRKLANMSLLTFQRLLQKWAYDVFSNTPRSKGMSPRQLWHASVYDIRPRVPANLDQFRFIFSVEHTASLSPAGLKLYGLQYQSTDLIALRKRMGHSYRLTFRYHPNDLTQIYVRIPQTKQYLIVPSTDIGYTANLNLTQHKWILKTSKELGKANPILPELYMAREELISRTKQLATSKRLRERKLANRIGDIDPMGPLEEDQQVSEIEYQLEQLSLVELENDEEEWGFPANFGSPEETR
ncbi:Mu transposase C-terminal domain-containing protein [Herbaspirillum huttiense]|uniref:Mu transposase C-terminal domain-containing protein n=1 Tax=Herbaspirillum huttiense TaxID=863372 RepID=UPI002E760689|nr:Mu transposase C-terminal domain-containing protein [Herbaspirillum huttiense]MEE1636925.1 Mu transposase C-terminal domain-containing protein [Herbaspirillum huttiense NC40101]